MFERLIDLSFELFEETVGEAVEATAEGLQRIEGKLITILETRSYYLYFMQSNRIDPGFYKCATSQIG